MDNFNVFKLVEYVVDFIIVLFFGCFNFVEGNCLQFL